MDALPLTKIKSKDVLPVLCMFPFFVLCAQCAKEYNKFIASVSNSLFGQFFIKKFMIQEMKGFRLQEKFHVKGNLRMVAKIQVEGRVPGWRKGSRLKEGLQAEEKHQGKENVSVWQKKVKRKGYRLKRILITGKI